MDWNSNARATFKRCLMLTFYRKILLRSVNTWVEWKNPLFTEVIQKNQVQVHYHYELIYVGPKLCVNESTKGMKNTIDIGFWFQQVHPSKARIIIHNCKKISKTIMCCQIKVPHMSILLVLPKWRNKKKRKQSECLDSLVLNLTIE